MSNTPAPEQLMSLVSQSIDRPAPDTDYAAFLEDFGVMAEQRLHELPAARQEELVGLVARDPVAAQLLADAIRTTEALREIEAEEANVGEAAEEPRPLRLAPAGVSPSRPAEPASPGAAGRFTFPLHARALMKSGFALAACLTLAVGVWRFVEPPVPASVTPDGQVQLFHHGGGGQGAGPDYWTQHSQQQLRQQVRRDVLRDYGLVGLGGLSAGLGLALILRRRA